MAVFIKVCALDDLPPGAGRVIALGGREVWVYNREGRVFAAAAAPGHASGAGRGPLALGEPPHAGGRFEVEQEDSLARMRAHAAAIVVEVRGGGVFVATDEAGAPVAIDQPARAF